MAKIRWGFDTGEWNTSIRIKDFETRTLHEYRIRDWMDNEVWELMLTITNDFPDLDPKILLIAKECFLSKKSQFYD